MIQADSILLKCGVQLNDVDAVRWSYSELVQWLNAGIRAIVLAKPSASAKTIQIPLVAGTLQTIPDTVVTLERIRRNVLAVGPPATFGRVVTPTARDVLDQSEPNWHNPSTVRFRKEVRQFAFDEGEPRVFYVYPGNDGTGLVEAVVSVIPALVAPIVNVDVATIAAWAVTIALDPLYEEPLMDYVMFRALSRDDLDGNPSRAMLYAQSFQGAVGIKISGEGGAGPNARAQVTQS